MMSTKCFALLAVVKPCNAKQWNKMLWPLMLTSVSTTTKLNYQEPYCCCKSDKTKCILNTSRTQSPCNFIQGQFDCVLQTFTHISWNFRKLENMNVNIWPIALCCWEIDQGMLEVVPNHIFFQTDCRKIVWGWRLSPLNASWMRA